MRKIIGREEQENLGIFIKKGALKFDEKLPIVWNFDFRNVDKLVGHATDFQREENGNVTAELSLSLTDKGRQAKVLLENKDCATTFFATNIEEIPKRKDGVRHVTSATLRCISIVLADQVPWGKEDL